MEERLREELHQLKHQLQAAERDKETMRELLRPVQRMRSEMSIAQHRVEVSEANRRQSEAQCKQLSEELVTLEAREMEQRGLATEWRTRCLHLERDCAGLATQEEMACANFQAARRSQRGLMAQAVEQRIACMHSENAEVEARAEAQSRLGTVQLLDRDLGAKLEIASDLRLALAEARVRGTTEAAMLQRLQQVHRTLEEDCYAQGRDLQNACERASALASRTECLEADLEAARQQLQFAASVSSRPVAPCAVGGRCQQGVVPQAAQLLQQMQAPPLKLQQKPGPGPGGWQPPRCRRDYPRSTARARLRMAISGGDA